MRAEVHPRQAERLAALGDYDILDTPREKDFDDIVQLASQICEAPVSVINLIDDARQWFKAEVGLGVRETPLDVSICSHAILQDDFVEIPDTLNDPRLADNPLCMGDDGLRFYAGARLMTSDNLPIGTLCVLDKTPRQLSALQRDALRVLSDQVMKQLELRRALRNQGVLRSEMDHRIKNSLQSTASVVRLYRRRIQDEQAQEALDAVERHIDATAALHQELQAAAGGNSINIDEFLGRIVTHLRVSCPENVHLDIACASRVVTARQAGSIGVIVSEFVANSIKHAFPDGRDGHIQIAVEESGSEHLILRCSDNGVGDAEAADQQPSSVGQIGLGLISAAASALGASVEHVNTAPGKGLTVRFVARTA